MAIEYAMLFTTKKKTKQECIHIHVIRETKKKTGEKNSLNRT